MQARIDPHRFDHETVHIIGGGPSADDWQLEYLEGPVIGCNDAWMYPNCKLCVFGDKQWYEHWKKHMAGRFAGEVWTNNGNYLEHPDVHHLKKCSGLSCNPERACWMGNTGVLAIQIALLGRPDRIILWGYDGCMRGDQSNWFTDRVGIVNDEHVYEQIRIQFERLYDWRTYYPMVDIYNTNAASEYRFPYIDGTAWTSRR